MTTKRALLVLGIALGVWACSSPAAVYFADAWIDVGESMRDAASDSAAAQVDMTAPCVPVGSLDYLYANGSRGEQVSYAADFRDASIDPATVRRITTISCGNVVDPPPVCNAPECSSTLPPRPDCLISGTAFIEAGHVVVNCGTATLTHNNPTPPYEQSAESHYTTVRIVLE